MNTTRRSFKRSPVVVLLACASLLGATGCGSLLEDRCDTVCECENCGEKEREACVVRTQTEIDISDIYECSELLDIYYECQLQKYDCEDGRYRDDNSECGRERDEYEECKRARSSRDPGPY